MPNKVNVILNFSKTSRTAFNVLVGALETYVQEPELSIRAARNTKVLADILEQDDGTTQTVVLWSFFSLGFNDARRELGHLKRHIDKPNIIHFAGGVHATAEPLQTLQAGFDFVAVGEGEQIIVDFVRCLLNGDNLATTQGIAWHEGEILHRNGRGELIDLNNYPPFAAKNKLFGAIEITRGCIYACKFCQTPYVSKARFRHRSIENIAQHARVMRSHGFKDYRFISPTSLSYGSDNHEVNLDAVEGLLAAMREAVGPEARIFFGTFPSETRPEHITREALRVLKKYVHNDNLIIGGQSGSQAMLDSSKRGHSVEAIVEAVRLCIDEGFSPNVDFLFGLPGESTEDVQQTLGLAKTLTDLGAKIHNHTFMPLPGTPFKSSDAGNVDNATQKVIQRLELDGKAYGRWKQQIKKAKELVRIRDEK